MGVEGEEGPLCELRFRNYVPKDKRLRQFCLPRPSVEELEKQINKEAQEAVKAAQEEDVLSQVVPRRPHWDLKRDVERKMQILSKRTDRAIIQLIREKIENNKKEKEKEKEKQNEGEETNAEEADEEEDGTKQKTREEREINQTVLNGLNEFDKLDEDDDV